MINMKYIYGLGAVAIAAVAWVFRERLFNPDPVGVWGQDHKTFTDKNGNVWTKNVLSDNTIYEYGTLAKQKNEAGDTKTIFMRGSSDQNWDEFATSMNSASVLLDRPLEKDMLLVVHGYIPK